MASPVWIFNISKKFWYLSSYSWVRLALFERFCWLATVYCRRLEKGWLLVINIWLLSPQLEVSSSMNFLIWGVSFEKLLDLLRLDWPVRSPGDVFFLISNYSASCFFFASASCDSNKVSLNFYSYTLISFSIFLNRFEYTTLYLLEKLTCSFRTLILATY